VTKQIDKWSVIVMAITLILFLLALFITGSTHDLLLETGVFLVSVKLILMSYKNGAQVGELKDRLSQIQQAIQRLERSAPLK
jgi:hypothetical protein